MNRKSPPGLAVLGEEGRRFFQEFALLGEHSDLPTEAAQLLALVAAQTVATALVDIDLARRVTQRLRRHPQLARELGHPLAAALEQLDRLAANSTDTAQA